MQPLNLFMFIILTLSITACAAPSPAPLPIPGATLSIAAPDNMAQPTLSLPIAESTDTPRATIIRPANLPLTPFPTEGLACGAIRLDRGGSTPLSPNAATMENCFADAFQQCRKATLMLTVIDPDEGILHTFTTQKAPNLCTVVDSVQHYNFYTHATTRHIYTCDGFAKQAKGLLFVTCGDENDIILPATLP